jgi:beta-lactamase class A
MMHFAVRHSVLAAVALALVGAPTLQAAEQPLPADATLGAPPPPAAPERPQAPPGLVARLQSLGLGFQGRIAIAVEDVQTGWIASYGGQFLAPQQSVSKLWVALAVFDAIDRGAMHLEDQVTVRREDMSVFYQPIQDHLTYGPYVTTVETLLNYQIAQSDNAANDILDRMVGGAPAIERVLADRRIGGIRTGPEEWVLQAKTAAVDWRPEYSFGRAFWAARDAVPMGTRIAALQAYLAQPEDGATAVAMVDGLARLKRGELLSPGSTAKFLDIMASTETGPMRLKSGLAEGWSIAHKTGTGQDLGDLGTGYNDVGLITAPDGHVYAVVAIHDGVDPMTLPITQVEPPQPPTHKGKLHDKGRSAKPRRHRQIAS